MNYENYNSISLFKTHTQYRNIQWGYVVKWKYRYQGHTTTVLVLNLDLQLVLNKLVKDMKINRKMQFIDWNRKVEKVEWFCWLNNYFEIIYCRYDLVKMITSLSLCSAKYPKYLWSWLNSQVVLLEYFYTCMVNIKITLSLHSDPQSGLPRPCDEPLFIYILCCNIELMIAYWLNNKPISQCHFMASIIKFF